ncbi:MFS transporter [Actinotignum urinale]|uniref:MFS transporter n=1 Tax=Actinotignum urinale TaxID=190146 RepID=UPI00047E8EF0|nr:MFS transporter [Actinotignum urinale]MDY5160045.1 MFS transporter [Actinotignum urinale]
MFITEVVPAILYGFFVLFLPESPRYLVQIGKYEEAETVLRSVGTTIELKLMIEDIKASLSDHKPRFSDLLDSKTRVEACCVGCFGLRVPHSNDRH